MFLPLPLKMTLAQSSCRFCRSSRLVLSRLLHTTASIRGYQLGENLKDCYGVLRVSEDSEDFEVRDAYLQLAKEYHPDSGSKVADHRKFAQVEEAYRSIMNDRSKARKAAEADAKTEVTEADFGIRHTAPQHRQYLSYEGLGFGTPGKREKQYQKYKVQRASENVREYKISKVISQYETALVTKDKMQTRKRTITRKYNVTNAREDRDVFQEMSLKGKDSNAIDRLVEDLIQESMAKGEFTDLPGKGKPVSYREHNPMVDTETHNLNKILINNGYVPEWVLLEKDIRSSIDKAKEKLWKVRVTAGPEPLVPFYIRKLEEEKEKFKEIVAETNGKIDNFNLTVPSLAMQKYHFSADKIIDKLFAEYNRKLENGEIMDDVRTEPLLQPVNTPAKVDFRELWKDIKSIFNTS